jgi:AraC-like DNA-binding protein
MIGIVQGLVAIPLLLKSKQQRLSKVFLALAILSFCLLFLKVLIIFSSAFDGPQFRYFPIAFEMATAPSFYFYFLALTEKQFSWKNVYVWHFVPVILAQSYAFLVYFSMQDSAQSYQMLDALHYTTVKEVENWLIVVSISSYLLVGAKKYLRFQQRVRDNTADTAYPTLSWLKSIIVTCGLLLLFLVVNMLVERIWLLADETLVHWKVYYVYVAGVTYYLGLMAFRQQAPDLNQIYPVVPESDQMDLVCDDTRELAHRIETLLKEQALFLDPNLNVSRLASELRVNSAIISQVINRHFGMSFRAYINEFRVNAIKAKLLDENNKASVLSLALESGFNSEASFYRVFKAATGQTPTGFIEANKSLS